MLSGVIKVSQKKQNKLSAHFLILVDDVVISALTRRVCTEVLPADNCTRMDVAVLEKLVWNNYSANRKQCLKLEFILLRPVDFVTWQNDYWVKIVAF